MRLFFVTTSRLLVLSLLLAASGALKAAQNPIAAWAANGSINAMTSWGSTLYVGGDFSAIGKRSAPLVVLAADGSIFKEINLQEIYQVITDDAGGWYILGNFNLGSGRQYILHYLSNGEEDPNFRFIEGLDAWSTKMLKVGNAIFLVGAYFGVQSVRKIDAQSGALQPWGPQGTFTADINSPLVKELTATADSLIIAGSFRYVSNTTARANLMALDLGTGTIKSWNPSVDGMVTCLALGQDSLYCGGAFTSVNWGVPRMHCASLDLVSGAVKTWIADTDGRVSAIALSGGKVWVGGSFAQAGGQARKNLAAFDEGTGQLDGWGALGLVGSVEAMVIDGQGLHVVHSKDGLLQYQLFDESSAALLRTRGLIADRLALRSGGGKIALGCQLNSVEAVRRNRLASIDLAASTVTSFSPNIATQYVYSLDCNGQALAAGGSWEGLELVQGLSGSPVITRMNSNWGNIRALAYQGQTLYVGGDFEGLAGVTAHRLARVDTSTGEVRDFGGQINGLVQALAVEGNVLFVGGQFTLLQGQGRAGLGAIDARSGQLTSWDPQLGSGSNSIETLLAFGGRVWFGGSFSAVAGHAVKNIGCVSADAASYQPFQPEFNYSSRVSSVIKTGGKLALAGSFTAVNPLGTVNDVCLVDPLTGAVQDYAINASGARLLEYCNQQLIVAGNYGLIQVFDLPLNLGSDPASLSGPGPSGPSWDKITSGMEKDVAAPVPAKVGRPVCIYPTRPALRVEMQVFNAAGQRVAELGSSQQQACWNTRQAATGVYLLKWHSTYLDGSSADSMQKVYLIP
jgi:hypothetical protein